MEPYDTTTDSPHDPETSFTTGYIIWGVISTVAFVVCVFVTVYIYHRYKRSSYTAISDTGSPLPFPCLL